MERAKVGLLAVIAVLLGLQAMPEAVAQAPGEITCNAWYQNTHLLFRGGDVKAIPMGRAYAEQVKSWMEQNPGTPVFRSTLAQEGETAYIDVMCVR